MTNDNEVTIEAMQESEREAHAAVSASIARADGADAERQAHRIAGQQVYRENRYALKGE